jgi:hypothetical protein
MELRTPGTEHDQGIVEEPTEVRKLDAKLEKLNGTHQRPCKTLNLVVVLWIRNRGWSKETQPQQALIQILKMLKRAYRSCTATNHNDARNFVDYLASINQVLRGTPTRRSSSPNNWLMNTFCCQSDLCIMLNFHKLMDTCQRQRYGSTQPEVATVAN